MYNYKLQFDYPKDYRPAPLDDGFDLNDSEKVKPLVDEALKCLLERKTIDSTKDAGKAGLIVEGILEEGLQGVDDRESLLGYMVDNYERALRTFDKISSGIAAMRSKQESPLAFDEEK
jgi:hypothetical protein